MQMFTQASDFVPIVYRNLHYVHLCTVITFLQVWWNLQTTS